MSTRSLTMTAIALCAAGCAHHTASIRATHAPPDVRAAAEEVHGPVVPAGTRFTVRMDDPIDSRTSFVGQPFTAHLEQPLRDANGRLIAAEGAILTGHVARLSSGRMPMIELQFDTIGTVSGGSAIFVSVLDAEHRKYRARDERVVQPSPGPYFGQAVHSPTMGGPFMNSLGDVGGGYAITWWTGPPREVRLDRGAALQLRLRTPLEAGTMPPGETAIGGGPTE